MSTEGSVSTSSSGIRQFGLYRTIDARTEEFLRLSRKRQIRQGCACAAISTAITVTVVITLILIYEYSIFHESSSKTNLKQNWLSLLNKSTEALPFEAKLNKGKINLDPMYVQFLPLILKTLQKNKYFDKIIEDAPAPDPTSAPANDKGEKAVYTKDIFSDSINWMRMPTSRLYTIEYKSSPIVYFKYPTRNIDYFTKIRRIRDYNRIMNYVDKMISDKVPFTSTIPMAKNTYSFHKKPALPIFENTTPMTKAVKHITKKQTKHDPKTKALKKAPTTIKNAPTCHCSKRISLLLSKLIKCLQKIIPDFMGSENKSTCNENNINSNKSATKQPERSIDQSVDKIKHDQTDIYSNIITTDSTYSKLRVPATETLNIQLSTMKNYQPIIPNKIMKTFYSNEPLYPKLDYTLSSIINLLKPHIIHSEFQHNNKQKLYAVTTKQYIEGTDADHYVLESATIPMTKITKASSNTPRTETDFVMQKIDLITTEKSLLPSPTFRDMVKIDFNSTPDVVDNFKFLDVHSLELAKKAILATSDKEKNSLGKADQKAPSLEPTYYKNLFDTWNILREKEIRKNNSHESMNKLNVTSKDKSFTVKEIVDLNRALSQSSTKPHSYLSINKQREQIKNEDVTLEEETDNASSEETIVQNNLKNLENLLNRINVSQIFNSTLKNKTEKGRPEQSPHRHTQKHTDTGFMQYISMIPENRPSYLEIQRNDWKHDEDHDYDNNFNNNYFP